MFAGNSIQKYIRFAIGFAIFNSGIIFSLSAQEIRIGLEVKGANESVIYQAMGEEVWILAGDSTPVLIEKIHLLEQVEMIPTEGKVMLKKGGKVIAREKQFLFWSNDEDPRFNLISSVKNESVRTYPDHLEVSIKGATLLIINKTEIERYLPAVVLAEAGNHKSAEFLKVQSVSARTYALANAGKHSKEGFDLCDKTHCQVYRGLNGMLPWIEEAVKATESEVIIFADSELVDAVFSANCGGFTANSEDVWSKEKKYLRAVTDSNYCEGFSNHEWHLMMPRDEFFAKLGKYYKTEVSKYEIVQDVSGRVKRIELNGNATLAISGEELRKIFRLKSSKFHVHESSNMLYIEGEGFGHGVGLCQDGAFYLSEMGLNYDEIIKHYYQGVEVGRVNNWELRIKN